VQGSNQVLPNFSNALTNMLYPVYKVTLHFFSRVSQEKKNQYQAFTETKCPQDQNFSFSKSPMGFCALQDAI
jgi:hypothetical protein